MAFGPPEIHPKEHLGPVGRLGAAGSRADRQDRRALIVLTREQQRGPLTPEVGLQRRGILVELCLEPRIGLFVQQLECRLEVRGTREETLPRFDLGTEAVGLAKDLLGGALVVPEPRLEGQCVELPDALLFGLEVKGAPRSTGSARRGRG
jgi:hypothetical protein